jgi:hypothetical protein
MERAFSWDFSRVHIRLSDAMTRIGARALTRGNEIIMAPHHYQPESVEGQTLIGHELAHVVQQQMGRAQRHAGGRGLLLDDSRLEGEAEQQGVQAAHGEPVALSAARGVPPQTTGPSQDVPIQPAWEFVQLGNRIRKYNLTDNQDGTWTHSKTGQVYQDTDVRDPQSGTRVLTPVAPPSTGPTPAPQLGTPTNHDPKNMLFRISDTGKFEYLGNTAPNRQQYAGQYLEMAPQDFALFKNSGKRTASPKIMDPVTLEKYAFDESAQQFYAWDPSQSNRRGAAISLLPGFGNTPSQNQQLLDRLHQGEIVDRRRADRTGESLMPFDVGPYKQAVSLPKATDPSVSRSYQQLTGITAWTAQGREVNRDHIPSGESLNQRGDPGAYNQGITIAIPNPEMHVPYSPTYGSDNSPSKGMQDEYQGQMQRRVLLDRDSPAAAAYRDTSFMLSSTENQDFSSSHKRLNLTKPKNQLRQLGGYRELYRLNVKLNAHLGKKRGLDPGVPAIDLKHQMRQKAASRRRTGKFQYIDVSGKTQGQLFAELYHQRLLNTKRAKWAQ